MFQFRSLISVLINAMIFSSEITSLFGGEIVCEYDRPDILRVICSTTKTDGYNMFNANSLSNITNVGLIRELIASECRLYDIDFSVFTPMSDLKFVNMSHNFLRDFSPSIPSLPSLWRIYLSHNMLTSFDTHGWLKSHQLKDIMTLELSENLLTINDSSSIFLNAGFRSHLYISNNAAISVIPCVIFLFASRTNNMSLVTESDGIRQCAVCQSVCKFDMSINSIKFIPETLLSCAVQLEIIDMSRNFISHLSSTTFKFNTILLSLNASHNQLEALPFNIFFKNTALNILDLSHNRLSSLPADIFSSLKELKFLNLSNNNIITLPDTIFSGLIALQKLDLSGNSVRSLSLSMLHENNITDLNLSHNQLSHRGIATLTSLRSLNDLDLSFNNIDSVPTEIFRYPVIRHLSMRCNLLSWLPLDTFKVDNPNLSVDLRDNPWRCGCFRDIVTGVERSGATYVGNNFTDGKTPVCIVVEGLQCERSPLPIIAHVLWNNQLGDSVCGKRWKLA